MPASIQEETKRPVPVISVVEPEPQGPETFGWSRSRKDPKLLAEAGAGCRLRLQIKDRNPIH